MQSLESMNKLLVLCNTALYQTILNWLQIYMFVFTPEICLILFKLELLGRFLQGYFCFKKTGDDELKLMNKYLRRHPSPSIRTQPSSHIWHRWPLYPVLQRHCPVTGSQVPATPRLAQEQAKKIFKKHTMITRVDWTL